MSDLTTYRIPEHISAHARKNLEFCIQDGVLVRDTRLQAIADAWKEGTERYRMLNRQSWPELADLLDALEEEDNHE